VTGSAQRRRRTQEHWLPCVKNEDEVDESQESQWKYESEVYSIN